MPKSKVAQAEPVSVPVRPLLDPVKELVLLPRAAFKFCEKALLQVPSSPAGQVSVGTWVGHVFWEN